MVSSNNNKYILLLNKTFKKNDSKLFAILETSLTYSAYYEKRLKGKIIYVYDSALWFLKSNINMQDDCLPLRKLKSLPEYTTDNSQTKKEDFYVDWFCNVIKEVQNTSLDVINTRTNPFLAGRKPDGSFMKCDTGHLTMFNCVALFEGKSPQRNDISTFSNKDIGELCQFLETLLDNQPWRKQASGFITNFNSIQFYRISRNNPNNLIFEESSVFSFQNQGIDYLHQFLCASPETLGHQPPIIDNINLTDVSIDKK